MSAPGQQSKTDTAADGDNPNHSYTEVYQDNYEIRYPSDTMSTGLDDDARIWRIYQDEAAKFDLDLVNRFKGDMDILLVFSGLFSAIVMAVIAQFHDKFFEPDWEQIAVSILAQTMNDQREASGFDAIPIHKSLTQLDDIADEFEPEPFKVRIAILWWVSLVLSLGTALLSVLVKQFLDFYTSEIAASPRTTSLLRHHRLLGWKTWQMHSIVYTLPYILCYALLLFFVSIIMLSVTFLTMLAYVIGILGGVFVCLYISTLFLPLLYNRCPYISPAVMLLYRIFKWILHPRAADRTLVEKAFRFRQHFSGPVVAFRKYEEDVVNSSEDELIASALCWLDGATRENNPSIQSILVETLVFTSADPSEKKKLADNARYLMENSEIHRIVLGKLKENCKLGDLQDEKEDKVVQDKRRGLLRVCKLFEDAEGKDLDEVKNKLEKFRSKYPDLKIWKEGESDAIQGEEATNLA